MGRFWDWLTGSHPIAGKIGDATMPPALKKANEAIHAARGITLPGTTETSTAPSWEDYAPPEQTYETWTGKQLGDWWTGQGQGGNWWDAYADILNPEGQADFDYGVYSGTPVAQMVKDAEGNYNIQKVYPEAYQLHQLRTENPEEWWAEQGYDYQDIAGSQPYQGMQGLIEQWQSPEQMQQDITGAGDYAAQALGYGTQGEMADALSSLNERLNQIDFSGQLTEDQQRALSMDVQMVRQENMKMLEAISAEGRHSAAFYKADELSSQVADMYVQGKLKYMESNLLRSQVEFNALQGRYESMVSMGMAGADQFLDTLYQNRMGALQGYATEISSLIAQNEQYIGLYEQHVNQVYQSIMADIGFDEHTMSMAQEAYEQYMAPALDEFAMELQEYEAGLAGTMAEQGEETGWERLLGGALKVATIALPLLL